MVRQHITCPCFLLSHLISHLSVYFYLLYFTKSIQIHSVFHFRPIDPPKGYTLDLSVHFFFLIRSALDMIWKVNLVATAIKNQEEEGEMDDSWEWGDGVSALHVVSLDKCVTAKRDVRISCKFPRATYTGRGNCIMHNPQLTYVICSVWPGAVNLIKHCGSTVPAGNSSTSLHYIYSSWKKRTVWCNSGSVLFFFCAIAK